MRTEDTLFAIASRFNVTVNLVPVSRLAILLDLSRPGLISRNRWLSHQDQPLKPWPISRCIISRPAPLPGTIVYITYGALFDFRVTAEGAIPIPSTTRQAVDLLKEFDIRPLAVITNWAGTDTFDPELGRAIIGNPQARANTIQNVLNLLQTYGFAGVNVDFENMYPEDRNLYTEFIRN